MEDFPLLETDRLRLRKLHIDDLDNLHANANNRKIADHIVNIPYPYTHFNAAMRISTITKGFANKTSYSFAIALKDDNKFIGEIGIHRMNENNNHAQIAYWIGEPHWNQGIASEAIDAILSFGFNDLHVDTIYAEYKMSNVASQRVLDKNGFKQHNQIGKSKIAVITKTVYSRIEN